MLMASSLQEAGFQLSETPDKKSQIEALGWRDGAIPGISFPLAYQVINIQLYKAIIGIITDNNTIKIFKLRHDSSLVYPCIIHWIVCFAHNMQQTPQAVLLPCCPILNTPFLFHCHPVCDCSQHTLRVYDFVILKTFYFTNFNYM